MNINIPSEEQDLIHTHRVSCHCAQIKLQLPWAISLEINMWRRQGGVRMTLLSLFSYAVIAYGCAECPKLSCGREGCDTEFCYHCRQLWHPNQTCDQARRQRARHTSGGNDASTLYVFNEEPGGGKTWRHLCHTLQFLLAYINMSPNIKLYPFKIMNEFGKMSSYMFAVLQMQRRSRDVLAVVPTSWRPMMAAVTAWTALCVPVSSAGCVCRRSPTCTTSGISSTLSS